MISLSDLKKYTRFKSQAELAKETFTSDSQISKNFYLVNPNWAWSYDGRIFYGLENILQFKADGEVLENESMYLDPVANTVRIKSNISEVLISIVDDSNYIIKDLSTEEESDLMPYNSTIELGLNTLWDPTERITFGTDYYFTYTPTSDWFNALHDEDSTLFDDGDNIKNIFSDHSFIWKEDTTDEETKVFPPREPLEDGYIHWLGNILISSNNTWIYPDGVKLLPNDNLLYPTGEILRTDGLLIYPSGAIVDLNKEQPEDPEVKPEPEVPSNPWTPMDGLAYVSREDWIGAYPINGRPIGGISTSMIKLIPMGRGSDLIVKGYRELGMPVAVIDSKTDLINTGTFLYMQSAMAEYRGSYFEYHNPVVVFNNGIKIDHLKNRKDPIYLTHKTKTNSLCL